MTTLDLQTEPKLRDVIGYDGDAPDERVIPINYSLAGFESDGEGLLDWGAR
jgi:hypothetical protein